MSSRELDPCVAVLDSFRDWPQLGSVAGEPAKKENAQGTRRRVPVQARSRKRYAAIVDSAAELFADKGFDATTIDAIAEGAETSVGSLYQFFPNKLEVFRAVADDALGRAAEAFAAMLGGELDPARWRELIGTIIDTFDTMHCEHPSMRALVANMHLYGEFAEADIAQSEAFVAAAERILAVWTPRVPASKRGSIARVVTHSIEAALVLSQRESTEVARGMLDETKVMIVRYLEPYIEGDGG